MRAVNLIPADQHTRTRVPAGRSGGAAYVVAGLIAGLAICALVYGLASHQISHRKSELASVQAQTAQVQARAARLTPYADFVALREQRVNAVTQLVDSRFDWAAAFYEIGRVLPSGTSITSLDGSVGTTPGSSSSSSSSSAGSSSAASSGASVTSATPPGSVPVFTLTGCTTSQSEVALALERLRLMNGVNEVQLQSATKSTSTGGGGGAGSCQGSSVAFNVEITYDPLPSVTKSGSTSGSTTSAAVVSTSAGTSGSSGSSASGSPAPSTSEAVR